MENPKGKTIELEIRKKQAIKVLLETWSWVEFLSGPVPASEFRGRMKKATCCFNAYLRSLEEHLISHMKGAKEQDVWAIAWPEMEEVVKLLDAMQAKQITTNDGKASIQ